MEISDIEAQKNYCSHIQGHKWNYLNIQASFYLPLPCPLLTYPSELLWHLLTNQTPIFVKRSLDGIVLRG